LSLSHTVFPLVALGVLLLTGALVGKVLCGWACPFGLVQDLLMHVPLGRRKELPASVAHHLRSAKWAVVALSLLGAMVAASRRTRYAADALANGVLDPPEVHPLGVLSDSPFSVFSPAATLFVYVPWLAMWNPAAVVAAGAVGWVKLFLLLATGVACTMIPRFFCRYLCPVAALLEPFMRFRFLRIRRSPKLSRDEYNKVMAAVCPTGVSAPPNVPLADYVDHPACIHCGRCLTATSRLTQELSF
jgi:polyferredoxin